VHFLHPPPRSAPNSLVQGKFPFIFLRDRLLRYRNHNQGYGSCSMSISIKFLRPTLCKSWTGSSNSRTKVLGRVRGRHLERTSLGSSKTNSKMSQKQTPSDFLKQIIGRPVVVKLNNGVDYRGKQLSLACACKPAENSSIHCSFSLTVHCNYYQLQK